ncbi:16S rRNA (cytosine(1402)-N(4))-methyltransferase RsmH [Candidatus Uhrbacteria bacterium]|nr:16S rRNA (cytosine(1402)-N(4))-methyltransferase RsmH [Candidatus Uhrbacteria bacterium]
MIIHRSVLLGETLSYLNVLSNHHYIDCTLGGGGHTEAMLEKNGPEGRVIAFELDGETIARTKKRLKRFGKRLIVIEDTFRNLVRVSDYELRITGVLYDLGTSMDLLKSSSRGFSFLTDEPLDMRFSVAQELTAADIVNGWREKEIADMIFRYGEERWSRRIARSIIERRAKNRVCTTRELVEAIESGIPARYRHGRIHCATRTFQALRIAVNDELGALEESLDGALRIVESGGRIVVISFHSLEDRIVKQVFKKNHITGTGRILTKKPIVPSEKEQTENPASRSAKLRALEIVVRDQGSGVRCQGAVITATRNPKPET